MRHPLIHGRKLPVVPDAELVDSSFGTGVVKVTPAHDSSDFSFAKRHPECGSIILFDERGKMHPGFHDSITGKDRLHARAETVRMLENKSLLVRKEDHIVRVGRCSRSGDIIEPYLRPQWFLRTKTLAEKVLQLDDITFTPPEYHREWQRWLTSIQDWCLSRQISWGHQIPAWRHGSDWIVAESEEEAQRIAGTHNISRDVDVLDTWFSSGLLPISALGWPDTDPQGYPLDYIESGSDILFFWLARMAMLCTHFTGASPFKEIILHPLVT